MAIQPRRHRFTTTEYYRMAEVGLLTEDSRVELIDGEIVDMSPIGPRHARSVDRLTRAFLRAVGDAAIVRVQNPIQLDDRNDPEPDLVLARARADEYGDSHPTSEDILLVIEVADTSLDFDRQVKATIYADAGIPELWIWDLEHDYVLVHREPAVGGYALIHVVRRGESITPLALPDLTLDVAELLG